MLAGKGVIRAGEGIARVGYGSKRSSLQKMLILPHPLTKFEIETWLNGVYSRDNLPDKIKDGAYVINIGTYWIALYVNTKNVTYFDSFGVEHFPKEIKKIINNKNIIANISRMQAYDSVMCGYFCIGFIDFMFKGNSFKLFSN